ncbi:MAG: shikimate kinase [Anaerolineae bacterium]|nr:shikimate kinase [Anaerolineae bacterium]MDW8173123.1 shikimate kinase [Anaerolineae bacterium]
MLSPGASTTPMMADFDERSLVLTGFMGTGKSTVGALLATQLQRPFIDVDELIVARTGWPIPDLFARYGEAHFRAIERGVCHEVAVRTGEVVATGGGALVDDASREVLLRYAFVVCLDADPNTIEARLVGETGRPLAGEWRERWQARAPIYASLPHHVWTEGRTPQQVAEEVIALWKSES